MVIKLWIVKVIYRSLGTMLLTHFGKGRTTLEIAKIINRDREMVKKNIETMVHCIDNQIRANPE